ncbi:MAG: ATP-binding cassette domain-containing protein [Firmicutes bacterium]|nr:ATP-binding cassette domain-containing protein [Bacillota bacterium]
MKLLEVKNLKKYFGAIKAVDDVSFELSAGETLSLVGESGCGKTTTGRLILQLLKPTAGEVIFEGTSLGSLNGKRMRKIRKSMQIIFQDPLSSLNPCMTVSDIIGEPLELHGIARGKAKEKRVSELLQMVGLSPFFASRYPHEFSGGQCQRIGIARALAVNPKFIVADEPVSALDVSVQAQVINLLKDIQQRFSLSFLFISHDLGVVKHISDKVAVMYLGKIVEMAQGSDLFKEPLHPYTRALLSAVPVPDPSKARSRERIILKGDIPSPAHIPSGCPFHTRCFMAEERCSQEVPKFEKIEKDHFASCLLI